ncbi:Ca2+ regulator and membrane fusion protein Fig1-domain-containing protein [Limtongia smithiae]|uniref:Ca2+ regulator and membrane fusion protein Fig1-domain-containing protein n=1 Tax=Limtongia smithiae TaxID=1125753 RepID=UPI0034D00789
MAALIYYRRYLFEQPTRFLRATVFLFLSITVILLVFIILGCTSSMASYSSVYAVKFVSGNAYVQASYYGICASYTNTTIACTPIANTTTLEEFTSVTASTGATVNLLTFGTVVTKKLLRPGLPIASLVIIAIAHLANCARMLAANPHSLFSFTADTIAGWASIIASILWGIGATWDYTVSDTLSAVVEGSTSDAVSVVRGTRMSQMGWAAFALLVIATACSVISSILDAHSMPPRKLEEPSNA